MRNIEVMNENPGNAIKTNVYNKQFNRTCYIDEIAFQKEMEANRFLLTTVYEFQEGECGIFKEVQMHPVTGKVMHLDIFILDTNQPIKLNVKLRLLNKDICEGVKAGGTLKVHNNNFQIECLPVHAVNKIEVDIATLNIGEKVTTDDLGLSEVKFINPDTIVSIAMPRLRKR